MLVPCSGLTAHFTVPFSPFPIPKHPLFRHSTHTCEHFNWQWWHLHAGFFFNLAHIFYIPPGIANSRLCRDANFTPCWWCLCRDANFTPCWWFHALDQLPHFTGTVSPFPIPYFATPPPHVSILTDIDKIYMLDSSSTWHTNIFYIPLGIANSPLCRDANFTPSWWFHALDQLPHFTGTVSPFPIPFFATPPPHVSILTDNDDIYMLDSSSTWHTNIFYIPPGIANS